MGIENFKKNLRYLRRKHGYGQPYIAKLCGKKDYTTVQRWEEGKTEPSLKNVYTLATLFGVTIDDLVTVDLELMDSKPIPIVRESLLPENEKDLVKKYRRLNEKGKEQIDEQFDFFLSKSKYTEDSAQADTAKSFA